MNLETGLYNALKDDPTIGVKLLDGATYNIYPIVVPENTEFDLAITYTEITQDLEFPNARVSIFQLNCIANDYEDALALADDVFTLFFDKNEYDLGGEFGVKRTTFSGRTAYKDPDMQKFIYAVEIYIKY